jgi:hypothetical protein
VLGTISAGSYLRAEKHMSRSGRLMLEADGGNKGGEGSERSERRGARGGEVVR